jgi:hypothetical protein
VNPKPNSVFRVDMVNKKIVEPRMIKIDLLVKNCLVSKLKKEFRKFEKNSCVLPCHA